MLLLALLIDLYSSEAAQHYAKLNAIAALNRRESERAAFLVRRHDGTLRTIPWQPGDATEATYKGRIPAGCIAIIHTHPIAAPQPSRRDLAESRRLNLPIIVITPDSVNAAMPDGTTTQLSGR